MSATQFDIYPSGNVNANGAGGAIPVGNITEILLAVTADNFTGTSPSLTAWLQSSVDGAVTWQDCPYELALTHTQATQHTEGIHYHPAAVGNTDTWSRGRARNLFEQQTSTVSAVARYHVFGNFVRLAWAITGTGPQCRLQAKAVGK